MSTEHSDEDYCKPCITFLGFKRSHNLDKYALKESTTKLSAVDALECRAWGRQISLRTSETKKYIARDRMHKLLAVQRMLDKERLMSVYSCLHLWQAKHLVYSAFDGPNKLSHFFR